MKNIFLFVYLFVMSIFDWRRKSVPAVWLAMGLLAAAGSRLYSCIYTPGNLRESIAELCFGMLPGIFLLLAAWLTQKVGWGDGVIMLIVGLCVGFRSCTALLCFSMLLAAAVSIVLLLLRKVDRHTALPYLPFVTAAYLAGIFISDVR